MTRVDLRWRVRGAARSLRRRVRLRTRLRRGWQAARRAVPRRRARWSHPQVAVAHEQEHAEVVVPTAGSLHRGFDGEVRSARVVVQQWRAPLPGWSGRLGSLPGLVHHEATLPEGGRGRATVSVRLAEPLPLRQVVAAVHPVLAPLRPLAAGPAGGSDTGAGPVAAAGPVSGAAPVTVDARAANPSGRQRYGPTLPRGELEVDGDGWSVVRARDGATLVAGRVGDPLDDQQRAALAELGLITVAGPAGVDRPGRPPRRDAGQVSHPSATGGGAAATARAVVQLAMTGVVLEVPDGSPAAVPGVPQSPAGAVTGGLAAELVELITAPLPAGADAMRWEARSVRQRRAAMRHHAAGLVLPTVSALLVSKRPELAVAQVAALAAQTYPRLQIVVALHGCRPPATLDEAAQGRPLEVLTVPAAAHLGHALQQATAAATGQLVTKVDDDDHYGPEHVWDLVLAHHYSGAEVVGKGAELVYVAPREVTVRRRMGAEFYTDTVAGGTLTLDRSDLAAVDGWPPVPRHVDRALLDRLLAAGGVAYRTHPVGFIYTRHGDGHTWQADADYFLHDVARKWPGLPTHEEIGAA